jgi:hypothetical protein
VPALMVILPARAAARPAPPWPGSWPRACRTGSPPRGTAEAVAAPLDHVAAPVALPVEPKRPARPPRAAGALVGPLGDGVTDATTAQQLPAGRVAVTLVADHVVGPLAVPVASSCRTTLGGHQGRLGSPPQAARTYGPPRSRPRCMDQSREAHHPARPLHSPEGGERFSAPPGGRQVVAAVPPSVTLPRRGAATLAPDRRRWVAVPR